MIRKFSKAETARHLVVIRYNFPRNGDDWYESKPMQRVRAQRLFPLLRRNGLQFIVLRRKGAA